MQITSLSVLKIHELSNEQYKQAYENGSVNPNEIYLTPIEMSNEYVSMDEFQALQTEFEQLKEQLNDALNRIIEIQNAYIDGIPVHFFVDGTIQCEYEIGMTWNDWIGSTYHAKVQPEEWERWSITGTKIMNIGGDILLVDINGIPTAVQSTDKVGIYKNYYFGSIMEE